DQSTTTKMFGLEDCSRILLRRTVALGLTIRLLNMEACLLLKAVKNRHILSLYYMIIFGFSLFFMNI
ncbi:hypothetical protein, partial [Paenibacillus popilliae]|uniref:hypothetical protein n=1 Tax=Paenibacillus popilliae TaxID=78057 RepID=UPI001F3013AB